ncbi:UDP-3-O-(3-hydroxymyristoyl)glucosamine N-acyltransferase [Anianabacter salinae]|uniref:UDP-3-O-(3-hydroxymyristoyl)glucosamine N-acyltransferase n=1 Tax=Anianabacter salinae TaxID=2851023 RepID=UPI00225DF2F1|nr:UDP-3-O-(3-hydroxymyristoyl)glucosamine N-acyltransferase [Anianabacter salinae]MBV0912359.1 UDP-3-O-(3-hydroxymyristoyl)glucosamine N-acyltransferase [Anianabacter salinae]
MADPRFFPVPAPLSLSDIAVLTGAQLVTGADPALMITGCAPLNRANETEIGFLTGRKNYAMLDGTRAGACLVTESIASGYAGACNLLIHEAPQAAYAGLAARLYPAPRPRPGIAATAVVDPAARIGTGVEIGPGCVIGAEAEIGEGSILAANVVIGPAVRIGAGARIGAGVSISHALVGARITILPNAAIGQDGFGYVPGPAGLTAMPQIGRVLIGDDVDIGALTTIDRGAGDDTVIGDGTKIDNQVQIGHNCRIGRHCVLAAQIGLSGSVTVGDGTMMGGKSGASEHVTIGRGVRLAAGTGVIRDIPDGETWGGRPARPVRDWQREVAFLRKASRTGNRGPGDKSNPGQDD